MVEICHLIQCNKPFSHEDKLKIHQGMHKVEWLFGNMCNNLFSEQSNLKTLKCLHSEEQPFYCDICNKPFSHQDILKIHQCIHSGEHLSVIYI
jgi:KRAB domain-containing zinc finger protein